MFCCGLRQCRDSRWDSSCLSQSFLKKSLSQCIFIKHSISAEIILESRWVNLVTIFGVNCVKSCHVFIKFWLDPLETGNLFNSVFNLAMENWGLITYPEFRLLFDSTRHLAYRQLNITATIAHEISHHWFGNLVSPKWWTYLWLNEGFAIFFETLAVDLVC